MLGSLKVASSTEAAPGGEPEAVSLVGVDKVYRTRSGPVTALEDLSFQVRPKEFVVVVGPSGCGKSTLLKIIAGLIPASSGKVERFGKQVVKPTPDIGMVFQTPVLLRWRNVLDNVLLPVEILGRPRRDFQAKAHELLERAKIRDFADKYPHELSGGMQQRVAICRALVYDPTLLLMDEPFGALDALTRDHMNVQLMRLWWEYRKTSILITHSIPEAVFLADRVLIMRPRPGRVIKEMKIDLPRPRHPDIRMSAPFIEHVRAIRATLGEEE